MTLDERIVFDVNHAVAVNICKLELFIGESESLEACTLCK